MFVVFGKRIDRIALAACLLAAVIAATYLRLPQLAARAMHADEANQARKAATLYETGVYEYDVGDHHGPSLYWLTLPSLWLRGVKDFAHSDAVAYRLVPVVFGLAMVLLVILLADGLGAPATGTAALLTALSPTLVFYSRYYIQETLLVAMTLAAIGCSWRYVRSGRIGWAIAAGAACGLMYATKETWVLSAAAMAAALALTLTWGRLRDGAMPGLRSRLRVGPLLAALAAACLVAGAFYSGFGRDWHGPWDSIKAYANYWRRGTQSGLHVEPWSYYFKLLLAWRPLRHLYAPEAAILVLAALGGVFSLSLRGGVSQARETDVAPVPGSAAAPPALPSLGLLRFLVFYSVILAALYAAIPYKTPWCALGFLDGLLLVAAAAPWMLNVSGTLRVPLRIGTRSVPDTLGSGTRSVPGTIFASLMLLAALSHLAWQSYLLNYRIPIDQRHPYGHSYTSPDVLKLAERLEALARVSPAGHDMILHVVVPEGYWPLPWYLRRFNADHVGYWLDAAEWRKDAAAAGSPPPAVILLSPDVQEDIDAGLRGPYNKQMLFGLRPPGVFLLVYVREDLWQAFLAAAP
jgi:uncharacterized protein (TIGR03663 family)